MKSPVFRSFRRRLLTGFLLIGMVPLILQTILSLSVFMTALNRNAQASADNRLSGLRWELERLLDVCEETAGALSLNERMRTALDGMGPVSATEIYSILYESAASILYGADISVYGGDGKRLFSTSGSPGLETLPLNWGLLRAAAASRGETALRNAGESQEDQGGDAVCLEIARALPGDGSGFVVIRISQRVFSRLLAEKYDGADDAVYVMDAYWRPVYSSNPARDRDEAGRLRAQYLAGQRLTGAEGDAAYYAAGIGDSGLVILLRQPAPLANWALMLLYWVTGVIILICLAVCLITAMNISSQLYKPVKRLNMAMTELENGNLDVRINSGRTDEMGQLSGRFDRMAGQLQINIKQSLERQKELDNTRLRMLQAQLNPHFLYNTLDAMKWICISNNVPEAAVVSSSLAEILRAGIAGHEFVPLN
ncbi:MAG: histidine kinase, partial [Clostridiales bacterium]|nr:histidine kinase [Clostridiales bacterium]